MKCSNLWKEDKSFDHLFVIQSASVVPWKELLKKKNQFLKGSLIRWHSDLRGQTKQSHKDHRAVSHPLAARLPLLHLQLSLPPLRHRGNFPSISSPLVLSLHQQPCGQARRIVDITKWLNSEDDRSPEELQNDSVFLSLQASAVLLTVLVNKKLYMRIYAPSGRGDRNKVFFKPPKMCSDEHGDTDSTIN